jgi:integrase
MKPRKVPRLCKRRPNAAYVTDPDTGKQVPLGPWGSADALRAYDRWCAAFLLRDPERPPRAEGLTVAELILSYLKWAEGYYRKHGRPTSEYPTIKAACGPLAKLLGDEPAASVRPSKWRDVQAEMVRRGWARGYVNDQLARLRRVFRWGVERELIPPAVLTGLESVPPLKRGRTAAPESKPIEAAPTADVLKAVEHCRPLLRAMVLVQLYGAMRPGEVRQMRGRDVDRSTDPWLYVPESHKTEHHGRARRIWLGPKAQAVLTPLLARADAGRRLFPGYAADGYAAAVALACKKAKVKPFQPRQLRHTQAQAVRDALGIETAQATLGHASTDVTEIYAGHSIDAARKAAALLG